MWDCGTITDISSHNNLIELNRNAAFFLSFIHKRDDAGRKE